MTETYLFLLLLKTLALVESFVEGAAADATAFQHRCPLVFAHSLARVCKESDFRCEVSVGFLLNFCDECGHMCGDKACQQITVGLPIAVRAYGPDAGP
jgi:hypothetical protein